MIDKEILVLDENDYLVVEKFKILGLSHILSKVLICIYNNICISKDIEIAANLKQPQVSIAIKKLKQYEYVNIVANIKGVRGRSILKYGVNFPLDEVIADLEKFANEEYNDKIEAAKDIRYLYKIE